MRIILLLLSTAVFSYSGRCQNNEGAKDSLSLNARNLAGLNDRYTRLDKAVQQQSLKALASLQRQETQLQRSVGRKDSAKAALLFSSAQQGYQAFQGRLNSPVASDPLKEYIPRVDSISTALQFLQQKNLHLPADQLRQVQALGGEFLQLQGRLQQANQVQDFIRQREQQLREQLAGYGGKVSHQLLGMNRQVYYYQEQLAHYKETLKDPEKMEAAFMTNVERLPAFQQYMAKNSWLARLLPTSPNYGTPQALNGLQTIESIQKDLQDRFGKSAITPDETGGASPLQQQLVAGQQALSQLKDKITAAGGSSTDLTQPDFTPNRQKLKTFLKRLEYGFNFQSQPGTSILPVTTDIGVSLGYKFSDKATAGLGASYKLGWGNRLNDVHFTSEGVGLRSYVDIKARGSWWITGGWEYNYYQQFSKLSDLRDPDIWQKSALIGITKKYKVGNRNGNVQLLYDLLSGQQMPHISPLKFRIGYSL